MGHPAGVTGLLGVGKSPHTSGIKGVVSMVGVSA